MEPNHSELASIRQKLQNTQTQAKAHNNTLPWTEEDDAYLCAHASDMSRIELALRLGRTRHSVASRLKRLGVRINRKHTT